MNSNFSFDPENTDATNYYYFYSGFGKDELDRIEEGVAKIDFRVATTMSGDADKIRRSRIKWIPQDQDWAWLYERLRNMIVEANLALWKFELTNMREAIQYTEYLGTDSGHYDWHLDVGANLLSQRKVSVTVQLSDPSEYVGGDLEIFRGGNYPDGIEKAPRNRGMVFIFPSYILHRVTPVTEGIRKSFVLWVGGQHLR